MGFLLVGTEIYSSYKITSILCLCHRSVPSLRFKIIYLFEICLAAMTKHHSKLVKTQIKMYGVGNVQE